MAGNQNGWRSFNTLNPTSSNYCLFSQTLASSDVANTSDETSIIGSGVGSLIVPANNYSIGNSYVARLGGIISNLKNNNITLRLKSMGVILFDTGLLQLQESTNQFWQLEINFIIRNVGGIGVASIVSYGTFFHIRNYFGQQSFAFNTINNTSFDTTILNTLDITAEWENESPSNSINTQYFMLNKMY
jgi:hypothetical protein